MNKEKLINEYIYDAIVSNDDDIYYKCSKAASELGDLNAMCMLASCYQDGKGVRKNKKTAIKYWREAANKGHIDSASILSRELFWDMKEKYTKIHGKYSMKDVNKDDYHEVHAANLVKAGLRDMFLEAMYYIELAYSENDKKTEIWIEQFLRLDDCRRVANILREYKLREVA